MRAACLFVALMTMTAPAAAQVPQLLGRRVTDVRLEADGAPVIDREVLALVETRSGDPLTVAAVRETIDHFVALGRYNDIQVFAEPDADGVRLRYTVVPIARITRLRFQGALGLDENLLRVEMVDQFGATPVSSRLPEMGAAIAARYEAHGYPAARVEVTSVPEQRSGQVTAVFAVTPGAQLVVGRATVTGDAGDASLVRRLGLLAGRPFDRELFDQRLRQAQDDLRDEGYYEAVVSAEVTAGAAASVDVAVRGDRGDRVRVAFAGDPLAEDRRRALVPIERLRSVEEEVVEDGSRNIEQYLRLEGYRA
ncbi:MAG TPA: POTRA domain-containing protein, partial [Vicinamibacterales bacterium]|nr:POTRA domain-containing protein [Vicinamibacterales bacterium]